VYDITDELFIKLDSLLDFCSSSSSEVLLDELLETSGTGKVYDLPNFIDGFSYLIN
jgi:hypothetical protein